MPKHRRNRVGLSLDDRPPRIRRRRPQQRRPRLRVLFRDSKSADQRPGLRPSALVVTKLRHPFNPRAGTQCKAHRLVRHRVSALRRPFSRVTRHRSPAASQVLPTLKGRGRKDCKAGRALRLTSFRRGVTPLRNQVIRRRSGAIPLRSRVTQRRNRATPLRPCARLSRSNHDLRPRRFPRLRHGHHRNQRASPRVGRTTDATTKKLAHSSNWAAIHSVRINRLPGYTIDPGRRFALLAVWFFWVRLGAKLIPLARPASSLRCPQARQAVLFWAGSWITSQCRID